MGDRNENWQLTQDTFNAHRAKMRLTAPQTQPWIERVVGGYEERGRREEAWQLTQDTFNAHRSGMGLTAPQTQPWIERVVGGYEEHECRDAIYRLYKDILVAYLSQRSVRKCLKIEKQACALSRLRKEDRLCDMSNFPELVENFFDTHTQQNQQHQGTALIEYITRYTSRETAILLLSREIPKVLRQAISKKLRGDVSNVFLEVGDRLFEGHKDVLQSQSTMLAAEFSGRFTSRSTVTFDEKICSKRSMKMMIFVMYGGEYALPEEDSMIEDDIRAADYLDITHLLGKDLSDLDIDNVNKVLKT